MLHRDETEKFPNYTSDEEGGSAIICNPELRAKMFWERGARGILVEWQGRSKVQQEENGQQEVGQKGDGKNGATAAADKKNGGGLAGTAAAEEDDTGYRQG